ncbi:MAG TPA: ABC transporter ATP-binding protein [Bacteroidales bacterium]|nr:ABC transporter ATP-binding protein [Bacteroidales bacterium]
MNSIAIEINKVALGYGKKNLQEPIKKEVSLSGKYGELVALIGANGIGKSTLMKTVCGFIPPFSGEVLIHTNEISNIRNLSLNRRAKLISFVGTRIITDSIITVFDYVALGRFPHTGRLGLLTETDTKKVLEALESVELLHLQHKKMVAISDGEKQRAGIACALAQDTPVVILDEPTAYLDIAHKFDVVRLLRQIAHEQNKLLIYSTHDLNVALRLADKLWLMLADNCLQGAPEDLVLSGNFDKIFANYNINFSAEKSDFVFTRIAEGAINIVQNSIENIWLANAFERLNYEINTLNSAPMQAFFDQSQQLYILKTQSITIMHKSIYELISNFNSL